jgi:hypothetical protein
MQRFFEHEDEVALAIDGQFSAACPGFDGQGVRDGAQQSCGGFTQQRGEVVGTVAVALDQARDVAHGADGFVGDVFDLGEVVARLRGVVVAGEDVLRDERDAAEAAPDLIVQIPRDALAQGFHLAESRTPLSHGPSDGGGDACHDEHGERAEAIVLPLLDELPLARFDRCDLLHGLAPLRETGEPVGPVEDVRTTGEAIDESGL